MVKMDTRKLPLGKRISKRLERDWVDRVQLARVRRLAREVAQNEPEFRSQSPVVFFKASTDIDRMSLNSAFHMLTAWALRLQGIPVVHFACRSGMSLCVLGTDRDNPQAPPPCEACMEYSGWQLMGAQVRKFRMHLDPALAKKMENLSIGELSLVRYGGLELGKMVQPSLRWILRKHHLDDDNHTRFLYRQYILSAWNVAQEFTAFIEDLNLLDRTPRAVVLFNGMFYPEAVVRQVAANIGIRVFTHEVAMQPQAAFFTEGEATAYPLYIPETFELTQAQNEQLDSYLEQRFKGNFSMAGIRFWPEMQKLPEDLVRRMDSFRQVVPVFTNVIFDTSQPHSNVVFSNMFEWLDLIVVEIHQHPDTLFVIRAHPDEMRKWKESRESVADWLRQQDALSLPNVVFFDSQEYVSSYELVERSKFVMVYNSSIGLEAAIMGKPVLSGGKARYTQYPIVFFPNTKQAFREKLCEFLDAPAISVPPEFAINARRFLYYSLYMASLPFEQYLQPHPLPGFVVFKKFNWKDLLPENSLTMWSILRGIKGDGRFLVDE
jgi:hypothetical protein